MSSTPRKSLMPWVYDSVDYYEHQLVGIRWMARRRNFLCADDMGLGKSLQAMTVFAIDVVRGKGDTAIVVCPVSLKGNWTDEFQKFTAFPHVVLGVEDDPKRPGKLRKVSPKGREAQLLQFAAIEGPKVLIANYEQIKAHMSLINSMKWHMRIFDEAHFLQNRKAVRTQACMKIKATRTALLTGTPMRGQVDGLWTLLNMIAPERFNNFWSFVNRYAVFGGYEGKSIIGIKNERELKAILDEVMIRRLKTQVTDLKEPRIIPRMVDLHPEQQKLYDELSELDQLTVGGETTEVNNALTRFLRHNQICATTATVLGIENDHSYKLDLAVDDAVGLVKSGEKLVAFTQFRGAIEAYRRRLSSMGIPVWELHGDVPSHDRQGVVHEWSAGKTGVLICQIRVAGYGLNMTAAKTCQFIDKSFSPGDNQQCIDRINRIGQDTTQPVDVLEYVARATAEARVAAILRQKKKVQSIIEVEDFKRKLLDLLMNKKAKAA